MSIHSSVIIERGAILGSNVKVDPFTIIRANSKIGDNTFIGSNCDIGFGNSRKVSIGADSFIRSHSILYGGSTFDEKFETGHRVTVRENVQAGINFRLGTLGTIQNNIKIGDYVRMHSNVHLASGTEVRDFVWMFPFASTLNDPHPPSSTRIGVLIKEYSVLCSNSLIFPGVIIGEHCLIGADAKVTKSTTSKCLYAGSPAKKICQINKIRLSSDPSQPAYPWVKHFIDGYPKYAVDEWLHEASD